MSHGSKLHYIGKKYVYNYEQCNAANDAADEIIRAPETHLLNQNDLFAAEGGWSNVGLTLGLSAMFAFTLFGSNPRLFSHFKNGQLNFREWAMLGGSVFAGAQLGQHVGVYAFGDAQKWRNHWTAYTFVKSQNRYEGRFILNNKPMYY